MSQTVPTTLPAVAMRIKSDPAEIAVVRKAVEDLAASAGFCEKGVADVGLSVNEALANVIRHAYKNQPGQPIEINAAASPGGMTVVIRDWGSGVVPDINRQKADLATPGGLGLLCLRMMMNGVEYIPQPDGMLLRLTKTVAA